MHKKSIVLSIILPVRNESEHIVNTLNQLYTQTLDNSKYEILVSEGMSDDDTRNKVETFIYEHQDLKITLLENTKKLSSSGRNLAVKNGAGEYFLLIDGHIYIDNNRLLEDSLDLAVKHSAVCLGRPQPLNPPGINEFQQCVAVARNSYLAHSPDSYIYSVHEGWVSPLSIGVMYRRDIFDQIGYFDENFDAAEDLEFNFRLEQQGIKCYCSPILSIYYYPRKSSTELFGQLTRYGYGRFLLQDKHKRYSIISLVPLLYYTSLSIYLIPAIYILPVRLLLASQLGIYILALGFEGIRLSRKYSLNRPLLISYIIFVIHAGIANGFLKGILKKYLFNGQS